MHRALIPCTCSFVYCTIGEKKSMHLGVDQSRAAPHANQVRGEVVMAENTWRDHRRLRCKGCAERPSGYINDSDEVLDGFDLCHECIGFFSCTMGMGFSFG